MKEQKTLNGLISYYEDKKTFRAKGISEQCQIFNAKEIQKEECYKEFISQLKQLKEDKPYQKMWEELKIRIDNQIKSCKDNLELGCNDYVNQNGMLIVCRNIKSDIFTELEDKYLGVDNNE